MKIAILGTRGIPNNYGGFEQFAEYISVGLVELGHNVTVYNPHFHSYQEDTFKGVKIQKIKSPEQTIGSMGNFIYDYRSLKHALAQDFDLIYEAGYGTASPSYFLLKNSTVPVLTNMDGLEWKRSKWNFITRRLMRYFEKLAIKKSHYLIADNIGIQQYYKETFNADTIYLPYGADAVLAYDEQALTEFNLQMNDYFILIARLEPENNITMILDAYLDSGHPSPFIVIGNHQSKYGKYLQANYPHKNIRFLGGIYDKQKLDSLRYYSKAYMHGHSVGGTNPSLLEAMASDAFIFAHGNNFNKGVLDSNAIYFTSREQLAAALSDADELANKHKASFLLGNKDKINNNYNWNRVIKLHEEVFVDILEGNGKKLFPDS
ncbi:glycosyltransferase involved in cell wall biosynthesis [Chitinophaga niastensis]|uniref:Glycosyltransferase involved in cell wall biosynthesis n=1 Tax=Chitinophaga niastensis TaxID=536980 RepID=A0A2P8HRX1_CHINA|nr:DUF1972 domain-containing protein [Chitinophaga niastensis]PSL48934.1 glycosyltransferase involved in cell wall biosynthesis [Chitinophaga niastensis]